MVRKIFWEDPYRDRTEAVVTGVQGNQVTLDNTVAFAYYGGQAFDTGTIGAFSIENAVYDEGEIRYTLSPTHTLKAGDTVSVLIDWERRYTIMKLHFAAELLLVILTNRFGQHSITRADILEDRAILDFTWEGDISAAFQVLEEELAGLIAANLNITSDYTDQAHEKRFWEIPGFAKVNCGGTHLKTSGEIGAITLKRRQNGEGGEGIEITLLDSSLSKK
jgi:Ser-tRNA(Ala) deacylase AlaX